MSRRIRVGDPMIFNMLEIHVVVEGGGVGPCEMLEQLDGQVDGYVVFDTHLGMVAEDVLSPLAEVFGKAFEQHGVDIVDIYLAIHCVADIHFLIPVLFAHLAHFLQRIETVDGKGYFGERGGHLPCQGVLAMAGVESEKILACETSLVGDTRLEGVA